MEAVESQRERLTELSLKIHSHPELAFQERKASEWLTGYLENNGFNIERGIGDLETAFRASYGMGTPVIACLAEYDALPKVGHACGHNLIAAIAVGAGIAARQAVDHFGGRVLVIGTPGEEIYGGKVLMAERGAFEGLDAAMMVHPGVINSALTVSLACQGLKVEFFGRAAHAAARPEAGINALEAMVLSFNGINSLRQHIRQKARIHGIITHGGEAANIVPEYSAGDFLVRADDEAYLECLKGRVLNCFAGAATATGTRLSYEWGSVCYAPMLNNLALTRIFVRNMRSLGRRMMLRRRYGGFGSTDMGNVSQLVPSIHPIVAIASPGTLSHSSEFAAAAAGEKAAAGIVDSAKALAMTAGDLLSDPEALARVKEDFRLEKGKRAALVE